MKHEPLELGLKIEDAILVNEKLKDFVVYKSGKPRIDFKNKEAMKEYNIAILGHVFGLDMDFHEDALIPTPINRYLFIKNIFDEKKFCKYHDEICCLPICLCIFIQHMLGRMETNALPRCL